MASQDHLVVAIVAGKNHVFGAVGDVAVGLLPPPLLQRSLSRAVLILSTGVTTLSLRSLSFPSDGESLPAISSVGAGATLVCGATIQESLQQARRQIWVLPFLPVKSLVQLFQNSIVV